jgi:outer membrane biosynthesis protein TonB
VILEIIIDTQGAVSEAKVLRSIPLLDGAAIDAVRAVALRSHLAQWPPGAGGHDGDGCPSSRI